MFKNHVRRQVEGLAFKTLLNKTVIGQKGEKMEYTSMKMTDYVHPECYISAAATADTKGLLSKPPPPLLSLVVKEGSSIIGLELIM